jgi:hypothetical protein
MGGNYLTYCDTLINPLARPVRAFSFMEVTACET